MTELKDIVAVSAVRTPMGSFGGTLKDVASYNLGATAIKAALEKSGFEGKDLAEVIYGSCRQAGNGPNPSRSAAIYAGLPNYQNNLKWLGFEDSDFEKGCSDRLVDAIVAWGDEKAIATRIQAHWDAGADHVCIQALRPDGNPGADLRALEALAPNGI